MVIVSFKNRSYVVKGILFFLLITLSLLLVACSNEEGEQLEYKPQYQGNDLSSNGNDPQQFSGLEDGQTGAWSDQNPISDPDGYSSESYVSVVESEFTLPEGLSDVLGEQRGPWNNRLLLARSEDGLTWTKENIILADRADVPEAILFDGKLWVYFVTFADDYNNRVAVAVSEDNGETWSFKTVDVELEEGWAAPVDPDVILTDDGELRIYLTTDPNDGLGPRTYTGTSDNGLSFTLSTESFAKLEKTQILDPTVIQTDAGCYYFAGGMAESGYHAHHGFSENCITFEILDDYLLSSSIMYRFTNGVSINGGYRFYLFTQDSPNDPSAIYSATSVDGEEWTVEEGVRLEMDGDLESDPGVKDSAVVQLDDGSYRMVYTSGIPS